MNATESMSQWLAEAKSQWSPLTFCCCFFVIKVVLKFTRHCYSGCFFMFQDKLVWELRFMLQSIIRPWKTLQMTYPNLTVRKKSGTRNRLTQWKSSWPFLIIYILICFSSIKLVETFQLCLGTKLTIFKQKSSNFNRKIAALWHFSRQTWTAFQKLPWKFCVDFLSIST